MPAKYSHVKKRPTGSAKKSGKHQHDGTSDHGHAHTQYKDHRNSSSHLDRHIDKSITQAMSAVSKLERTIARILLIRFEQDMARLFSTHLYCIALLQIPTFVTRCVTVGGPGWVAVNADCGEIKEFFRSVIAMDLRQAGERVATKSVLWTYTALRHFAISHNVPICRKRGLHSLRLLPHYPGLKAYLDTLEDMPPPTFTKPPHLGPLTEGVQALEEACENMFPKDPAWREKIRVGYERICNTLWRVAREFDVRGYGLILREKLTSKWCDCGCSTDHLSEVCEKTVQEDEEESGVRPGKEREWDGRGSGIYGWGTEEEGNIWEVDFDFVGLDSEDNDPELGILDDMTIGELMEWRYLRAEHEKELGNKAFKEGQYRNAVQRYQAAHQVEPELPHYQLNLAAAYLKQENWEDAERACDTALSQHRSLKGYWRRAQARKGQNRVEEAIKDLRAVLKIQPTNADATRELTRLQPSAAQAPASSFASAACSASSSATPLTASPSAAKQKQSKPLPFRRTEMDDRKLKISCLPFTMDVPVDDIPCMDAKGKMPPISSFKTTRETFQYPSWERYVIQRVT